MSILRSVERRLEGLVEGFFAATFRSGLHPVELAKRVAREMEAGKTVGVQEILAPNRFVLTLSEADAERFHGAERALREELSELVLGIAAESRWTLLGEPEIEFASDPELRAGRFSCEASLSEGTRIDPPSTYLRATLELEDAEGRKTIELGSAPLTLGRLSDCEVVVHDAGASRHHARIAPSDDGYVLEDLGSTNGTLLNGTPVARAVLEDGDVIRVGTSSIVFRSA